MENTNAHNNEDHNKKEQLPDSLNYPPNEDIYRQFKKEEDVDPENPTRMKTPVDSTDSDPKEFPDDVSGSDLDIPGAELDDDSEMTGNEDEENNHYSIGGDNHTDLEENRGANDL